MFLNNQEAIMCDKNGLKSEATIILQRVEEVFPALKENMVSVLYRTLILINVLCVLSWRSTKVSDKEGYGVFTELHSFPASSTTFE